MMAAEEKPTLQTGEVVKTPGGEPFGAIDFARTERDSYVAEVGKKGGQYIYHFYPKTKDKSFRDKLEAALLEVFKNSDQIEISFIEKGEDDPWVEVNSWAVRVRGFGSNIWGDELAVRVFNVLDESLAGS